MFFNPGYDNGLSRNFRDLSRSRIVALFTFPASPPAHDAVAAGGNGVRVFM
jgi:hypothetical protein